MARRKCDDPIQAASQEQQQPLERAETVPVDDKQLVMEQLNMYDNLFDEEP